MTGGLEFRIAGIPVRVLPFFFFAAVLLGFQYQDVTLLVAWVGLMFVGVLLHELGHALVYRAFGVQPQIVLHGFGGLTFGRSLPVAKDLAVSLAGPAVGLVIGIPLLVFYSTAASTRGTGYTILAMAIFINLGWAIINLLPVLPLDGGNATNALLSLLFRRDMTVATRVLSIITATALILVALYAGYLFGIIILAYFIFMNVQGLSQRGARGSRFSPAVTQPPPPPAGPTPGPPVPPIEGAGPDAPGSPAPATWGPMPSAPPEQGPVRTPRGSSNRTFGDEMASATRSLATGHPELASLSVERARRMITNADEQAAVDRLEAHVAARLTDREH